MSTASEKRETHIVEYLLFVWQMEDLARAAGFDAGVIRSLSMESMALIWSGYFSCPKT